MATINNIIFDVGNVLVAWSPEQIVTQTFGVSDPTELVERIFRHPYWKQLNRGECSEEEAKDFYQRHLEIDRARADLLFENIKSTQTPVDGSFELLEALHSAGYALFALTDNVREIVIRLRERYDFWDYFKGVVVSAEVGVLKPAPEIYQYLLQTHGIDAATSVFLDDTLCNVVGAREQGIHAIQFRSASQCTSALRELGVTLPNILL